MDDETKTETTFTADDDVVAVMRAVGERAVNAEKMSFVTGRIVRRRPEEHRTHQILVDELHGYLMDTATMVYGVRSMVLSDDDGG